MAPSKSGAPKYYAVRVGHESGVYFTWAQCQEQIRGFKGAQYKSFLSYQDATDFVAGRNPPDAAAAKPKGNRFYGVAAGHKTGVFTDWTEVTTLIHGYKNPKYKRFNTHDEAEAYVKGFNQSASKKRALRGAEKYNVDYDDDDDVDDDVDDDEFDEDALEEALAMPPAKRAKSTADLDRSRSAGSADSTAAVLEIYTDGSSRGNGRAGAEAGVGVYFGLSDPRNVSERLPGLPQTNQRAELFAIARALQQSADHDGDIRIFTDSNYAIKCLTEWCDKWIQNNWMNDSAAPVKNQDLIKLGLEEMAKVEDRGHRVELRWVKGHGSNVGNIAADQLAVAGSRKPPVTGI